ncbi:CsbD family protein [Solimonas variicoloris]|uniref:CsbD family protein n=1 Tax=Solimonas variicoloris TaxID=254408 RepID=UPI00035F27AA|nr:CsbD family protein [Solimonas variicoloris]
MNRDTLKGQWKQLKGRAKETWGQLTDDELMRIEGSAERLSGLVQERYGLTRDEAERQIDRFLDAADEPPRRH